MCSCKFSLKYALPTAITVCVCGSRSDVYIVAAVCRTDLCLSVMLQLLKTFNWKFILMCRYTFRLTRSGLNTEAVESRSRSHEPNSVSVCPICGWSVYHWNSKVHGWGREGREREKVSHFPTCTVRPWLLWTFLHTAIMVSVKVFQLTMMMTVSWRQIMLLSNYNKLSSFINTATVSVYCILLQLHSVNNSVV